MERCNLVEADAESVAIRAAEILRNGGVVLHPSDTVYGLACDATNETAVSRIINLKQRPVELPFIILVSDTANALQWGEPFSAEMNLFMERVVPAPVTFVLKSTKQARNKIIGCASTIAIRIPAHRFTQCLCRFAGSPILSTSANIHGNPVPETVAAIAKEIISGIDLLVDGGALSNLPSTILDCTGPRMKIIREGAVSRDALLAHCGASLHID